MKKFKTNFVRLGPNSHHEIRRENVSVKVTLEEFVALVTPHVPLLFKDFEQFVSLLESDGIVRPWSRATENQKALIAGEYMEFFTQ